MNNLDSRIVLGVIELIIYSHLSHRCYQNYKSSIVDELSVYFPGMRSSRWLKWKEVKTIDLFVHKVYKDEIRNTGNGSMSSHVGNP